MGYHGNGRRATSQRSQVQMRVYCHQRLFTRFSSTGYDTIFTTQCMKSKDIVSKHVLYDRTEADSPCLVHGDNKFSEKQCSDLHVCHIFNLQLANQNCSVAFKGPHIVQISVCSLFWSLIVQPQVNKKYLLVSRKLLV